MPNKRFFKSDFWQNWNQFFDAKVVLFIIFHVFPQDFADLIDIGIGN